MLKLILAVALVASCSEAKTEVRDAVHCAVDEGEEIDPKRGRTGKGYDCRPSKEECLARKGGECIPAPLEQMHCREITDGNKPLSRECFVGRTNCEADLRHQRYLISLDREQGWAPSVKIHRQCFLL